MELEIGMYVRTINGKIWIIKSQQAISGHRKDIINASYDMIDLIEVGDYVNGEKVCAIGENSGDIYIRDMQEFIFANDIKSIVTHEQFSQMEYRIGE